MSDTTKTESETEPKPEVETEVNDEGVEETEQTERTEPKTMAPLDRSKFGKYIVSYGKIELLMLRRMAAHEKMNFFMFVH